MERLVRWSIAHRTMVVVFTLVFTIAAAVTGRHLAFDAMPDVTSNQVLVLTRAPGLTPEEVERLVTRPIETALGGVPGVALQRSLSRYGISSVTVIFEEDVPALQSRQLVGERLTLVQGSLPDGVDAPELGPLTGGLGEIFHVALSSPIRSQAELLELAQLRIAPLLRQVQGVVEVNPWGGAIRTLEVVGRPADMARYGVTVQALQAATQAAVGSAAGASLQAGSGQVLLRGVSWPRTPEQLAGALVPEHSGDMVVRLQDVADVREGQEPRIGAATANGDGEVLYLMVQMLRDANALEVMQAIHERLPAVRATLPPDVSWQVVYDRSDLVVRTLQTVGKSLAEGGILVVVVLLALLGSLRAGLLVALVIPLSMLGATVAMVLGHVPGNLMSLGALDFGLLVDGAVVMVEGLFHAMHPAAGKGSHHPVDHPADLKKRLTDAAAALARPVFYGVLIIVLVYIPVLSLQGVDGKMFRPMALTVIFALSFSLLLALTFIPAAASWIVRPQDVPDRPPLMVRGLQVGYAPLLKLALGKPLVVLASAVVLLGVGGWVFAQLGSSFVPQLEEGDLVIQSTRAPDISLEAAVEDAGRMERILRTLPEVEQVVSRVGSPAVATDIMGLEQADVFVELKDKSKWRPGLSKDQLIAQMQALLAKGDPGNEAGFTQPIQMRFNELVGGSVTDVDVSVYGEDLQLLRQAAEQVADRLQGVKGAADVRVLAPPEVPVQDVVPLPLQAARHGWTARDVLDAVAALRTGLPAGQSYDGPVRLPVRVRLPAPAAAFDVGAVQLPTADGKLVPLSQVAEVRDTTTAGLISRQSAQRRLVVGFNVRGAELGDVVQSAQKQLAQLRLPDGFRLTWGGQYESLQEARARLAVVIPVVLIGILAVLLWTFGRIGPSLLILLNVPFACVGGAVLLWARDLPISMPAAVGFIALSGIAVLNGVVWMGRLLQLRDSGQRWAIAAKHASDERMRPVLMTALVALLGFVPMMLATGPGSEVQRPLATVVVGGLPTSTLLTLVVLPALIAWWGHREQADSATAGGEPHESPAG